MPIEKPFTKENLDSYLKELAKNILLTRGGGEVIQYRYWNVSISI